MKQKRLQDKKNKRSMGSFIGILRYILAYRVQIVFMLAAAVVGNLLSLRIPSITGDIIDLIEGGFSQDILLPAAKSCMVIVLIALASWILGIIQGRLMLYCAQNMVQRLRHDVFSKLMRLPVSYFDHRSKGDIISVVSTDIDSISDTVSSDIVTLISGAVTVSGALVMMIAISPVITLIFLVTVPLMFILARLISKKARVLHRRRKDSLGKLTGYAEEMITAQKTVKAYGLEEYNKDKFAAFASELNENGWRAEYQSSVMMPTMNGINNLNFTLVCILGAFMALRGSISVGDIFAFALYSKRFSHPIVDTANIINMFQTTLAACDRVFAILNAEAEAGSEVEDGSAPSGNRVLGAAGTGSAAVALSEENAGISFENVNFSYLEDTPVLKDINIDIKPGECVAVVGATGSGKTTLASLLLRFYDVDSGKILMNGEDIRDIPLFELRRRYALILQDSWLFEGSVYDNIAYAAPQELSSKEQVREICKKIQLDEFIESLPKGYDTILKNDSGSLSQGQKQLLNMARAYLCNPQIFILDEATSSVDTVLEAKIQQVTENVIKGKTSIIIAHRLSTILKADRILLMQDGEIIESGSHKKLMENDGMYRRLYESQFAQTG